MFDDIKDSVSRYIELKEELTRVEAFLKESLRTKLRNTKQEDVLETIILLLNNQKSSVMINHDQQQIKLDAKEQVNGRI